MDVRPLSDTDNIFHLIQRQPLSPFLQSRAWGDFQKSIGRSIWRLGAFDGEQLVGAALVIQHELLLGKSYLYCPRGPLADTPEALRALFSAIESLGKEQGVMYVKVDPTLYHFMPDWTSVAPTYAIGTPLEPRHTQVLNAQLSDEDLLAGMHQKVRYNLRLAQKKGVQIRWSTSDEDFAAFMDLHQQTFARQGIRMHPRRYYELMFTTLREQKMIELGVAEYEGKPIVINEVVWYGKTATYLHGGSSDEYKNVMAPYLLQWETLQRARPLGMTEYDLRGIAPADRPDHKLAGVTRFKKGFGGKYIEFPNALNVILQPQWYQAYRLAKRMRGGVDE